jgi:hypothetical protein
VLSPLAVGVTVTVTRRTASGRDSYGNDTYTSTTATYSGCGWWPGSAGRNVAGSREAGEADFRNQTTTRAQVMLPSDAVVGVDDLVTLPNGSVWSVYGEGQQWQSQLTGASTGIQVSLERVDG